MALFMGLYDDCAPPDSLFESGVGGELVREAGIYPVEPVLSRAQWKAIVTYFQEQAPAALPPAERPPAEVGLKHFTTHAHDARVSPPMTSLVQVDPARSLIYVGDVKADYSTLAVRDPEGKVVQQLAPLKGPAHLGRMGDTLFVLEAGRLLPTDAPSGRLVKLFRLPGQTQYSALAPVLDSLHRPVHFTRGDLSTAMGDPTSLYPNLGRTWDAFPGSRPRAEAATGITCSRSSRGRFAVRFATSMGTTTLTSFTRRETTGITPTAEEAIPRRTRLPERWGKPLRESLLFPLARSVWSHHRRLRP